MSQLLFRNAIIRHFDCRQDKEAGKFIRIHMSADFSEPVRDCMHWAALADTTHKAGLDGELACETMVLTPNGLGLERQELEIAISSAEKFEAVRVKDKVREITRTELRFRLISRVPGVGAFIEQYLERVGRTDGVLKLQYEAVEEQQPTDEERQEKLPLTASTEGAKGVAEPAEEPGAGAALASAHQVSIAENGGKPPRRPRSRKLAAVDAEIDRKHGVATRRVN